MVLNLRFSTTATATRQFSRARLKRGQSGQTFRFQLRGAKKKKSLQQVLTS
jgi:hypothetical protein